MRNSLTAVALSVTFLLISSVASAEQPEARGATQLAPAAKQTTYQNNDFADYYNEYDAEQDEASPSDAPAPVDNGCCDPCCDPCNSCCEQDPWKLFDCCCLDQAGLDIGGWISQGITFNSSNPADRFNGPVTFNDRAGEYQLNQMYFYMGREADTGGCGADLGGRVDVLYGSDWRFTPAVGLENNSDGTPNWNQDHRFYGMALPQLYGEVAINDLSIKIGHFYTIIGYEVVTGRDNFFYSHAYTMQYGEPFTHTGALASLALTDSVEVLGGIHRGWDQWEDLNTNLGFLGGVNWTPCDNISVAWACTWSDEPSAVGLADDVFMYSLVSILGLTENLTYVFQHDLGHQSNGAAAGQSAEWYGINQYLLLDLDDVFAVGVRAEWFRDDDGIRVGGLGTPTGSTIGARGWGGGGFAGDFYEIAVGLNTQISPNLILRNELRWDWYSGLAGPGGTQPYDAGTDSNQFLYGINAVVTY